MVEEANRDGSSGDLLALNLGRVFDAKGDIIIIIIVIIRMEAGAPERHRFRPADKDNGGSTSEALKHFHDDSN